MNSDLPGDVAAIITEDVRDTPTGDHVLIPAAAKLYGRYNDQLSYGQRRAQISWTRILFPDGSSQNIGSMAGTDGSGAAGIEGEVDRHWGAMAGAIGGTALFTVLGQAGAILRGDGGNTNIGVLGAGAAGDAAAQVGSQLITRELNRPNTLIIPQGSRGRGDAVEGPGAAALCGAHMGAAMTARRIAGGLALAGGGVVAAVTLLGLAGLQPFKLNGTRSLPHGLYVRTFEPPRVGRHRLVSAAGGTEGLRRRLPRCRAVVRPARQRPAEAGRRRGRRRHLPQPGRRVQPQRPRPRPGAGGRSRRTSVAVLGRLPDGSATASSPSSPTACRTASTAVSTALWRRRRRASIGRCGQTAR